MSVAYSTTCEELSIRRLFVLLVGLSVATASRLPLVVFQHHHNHHYHLQELDDAIEESTTTMPLPSAVNHHPYHMTKPFNGVGDDRSLRVLYQVGSSEEDLSVCKPWTVCSKVDLYESPWVERQCRCPGKQECPSFKSSSDGHTLSDKTRQFKMCEPVKKLPKCRYFRDITWTLISSPDNTTEQVVHCHCPKGSVAYLIKRQGYQTEQGLMGYHYSFACSPQSRLRCQRKEPCRLFTVRKRQELLDEVNTNTLCQCPHAYRCPRHHTDPGVIQGKSYTEEAIKTYSGYCAPISTRLQ